MSARLSYSLPKALSVRVRRATRPSSVSKIMAMNTAMPAMVEVRVDGGDDGVEAREQAARGQQVGQQVDALAARAWRVRVARSSRPPSYQGPPVKMRASLAYPRSEAPRCAVPIPDQHHQGNSRRGRSREPSAHAARGPDPPPGRGLYTWLPMGLRAMRKVEHIVREEMNRAGALELRDAGDPAGGAVAGVRPLERVRPGAAAPQGPSRARLLAGPTHEEVITDIARRELKSYRQLPVNFYQIQTKFRDEIRPRFGVMRAREFLMKDAYSFHLDQASLQEGYDAMYEAYTRIFTRIGLKFRAVRADSGAIGGDRSRGIPRARRLGRGRDRVLRRRRLRGQPRGRGGAAAGRRRAPPPPRRCARSPRRARAPSTTSRAFLKMRADALRQDPARRRQRTVSVVALVLRGDHELNAVKAQKLEGVARPLRMASAAQVQAVSGTEPGFVGSAGLKCRVYADHSALALADFVCGANEKDVHLTGVNWDRDVTEPRRGGPAQRGRGRPEPHRQGHAADRARHRGRATSSSSARSTATAMKALVLDESGNEVAPVMGCYGIGVTRDRGRGHRAEPR